VSEKLCGRDGTDREKMHFPKPLYCVLICFAFRSVLCFDLFYGYYWPSNQQRSGGRVENAEDNAEGIAVETFEPGVSNSSTRNYRGLKMMSSASKKKARQPQCGQSAH
jgi:hypothetical protein